MALEHADTDMAEQYWLESIEKQPSSWVYRNLSILSKRKNNLSRWEYYLRNAWAFMDACSDQALTIEYIALLNEKNKYQEAWTVYQDLPVAIQMAERIQLLIGIAALELEHFEFVEVLFTRHFASIREGELILTNLWFQYHAKKLAMDWGVRVDQTILDEVKAACSPPSSIDFRMG